MLTSLDIPFAIDSVRRNSLVYAITHYNNNIAALLHLANDCGLPDSRRLWAALWINSAAPCQLPK